MVSVGLQGGTHILVSQPLGNSFEVHSSFNQSRCVGVSQAVQVAPADPLVSFLVIVVQLVRYLLESRFQVFRTVAIPAATPFIITGYRIALAAAWTTLVAAELIAAPSGLGFMLQEGRRYFLTDQVMMIIVIA